MTSRSQLCLMTPVIYMTNSKMLFTGSTQEQPSVLDHGLRVSKLVLVLVPQNSPFNSSVNRYLSPISS
jgi:hypothetical protein